ncbi:MAG: hypothetical protein AAFQ58_20440 [Pseudomonadota bacterium]
MKKYDDASWHYNADNFPKHSPASAGAPHISMFFAWIVANDLCSEEHRSQFEEDIRSPKSKLKTPGRHVFDTMDGQLLDQDLSIMGQQFAEAYFDLINDGEYLADYFETFETTDRDGFDVETFGAYSVEDNWENYDRIAPVLSERFSNWLMEKKE